MLLLASAAVNLLAEEDRLLHSLRREARSVALRRVCWQAGVCKVSLEQVDDAGAGQY